MTRPPFNTPRSAPLAATLAVALVVAGCAGYRAGADTLYAPDVATVYVPMVESESFRRDLGERLTEALIKEIELKTPYKVVASPNADSILEVRIGGDSRSVQAEDQFDNPRIFATNLYATATWLNRRRIPLAPTREINLPSGFGEAVGVTQQTPLIAEAGQSLASQQQLAVARLAEQIVGVMEEPW